MSDDKHQNLPGQTQARAGEPQLNFYPPPPPGPPPGHQAQVPLQHTNETPIHDYNIPSYNPANPQFAPPPAEEIYEADTPHEHHQAHQAQPQDATTTQGVAVPGDGHGVSKPGWADRLSALGMKAAVPFNTLAGKLGSETFLPTTMDKECEKAARILRSFCKDGIYADSNTSTPPTVETQDGKTTKAKPKSRTLLTIPSKVISRAVGLAIFTTARAGFHVSGATGSGILLARLPDGSWSPPSGIQVHSVGAGFVIGADIYDCVVVINTKEALEAFTRTRMSFGSDLAVVAGPWGAGGSIDFAAPSSDGKEKGKAVGVQGAGPGQAAPQQGHPVDVGSAGEEKLTTAHEQSALPSQPRAGVPTVNEPAQQPQVTTGTETAAAPTASTPGTSKNRKPSPFRDAFSKPVYSYVKSRGFYAGVQIDGTVVTERKDANAAFFGEHVSVEQILKGQVPAHGPIGQWPTAARQLFDVVTGAEGWRGQGQGQGHTQSVPSAPNFVPPHTGASTNPGPTGTADTAGAHPGAGFFGTRAGPDTAGAPTGKAGEAAAHQEPPPPAAAPPYSEPNMTDEQPPAYVDDDQLHHGVGDTKGSYQ